MGYPEHIFLAIGHLAEASEECYNVDPNLAKEIRQYRLLLMENNNVEIPFFELYKRVKKLIEENGCGDCDKASSDFKKKIMEQKKKNFS